MAIFHITVAPKDCSVAIYTTIGSDYLLDFKGICQQILCLMKSQIFCFELENFTT